MVATDVASRGIGMIAMFPPSLLAFISSLPCILMSPVCDMIVMPCSLRSRVSRCSPFMPYPGLSVNFAWFRTRALGSSLSENHLVHHPFLLRRHNVLMRRLAYLDLFKVNRFQGS